MCMELMTQSVHWSDKLLVSVAESASALTLQEPEVSSSEVLLDFVSSEEFDSDDSTDEEESVDDLSLGPKILIRDPPKWYQVYFIRTDRSGLFHMYPDLGGPFQSLDEVDCAISHHLAELQSRSVLKEPETHSTVDRLIHERNYYPDGTPKRGPKSRNRTNPNEEQHYLVQALLDQYNDSKNLFGNLALELKSLLRHKLIYGKKKLYYHFNFTTKAGNLFFAEVSQIEGEGAWKATCCCMIDSNENGQCNTCRNDGCPDMKHPNNTGAYTAGRLNGYFQYGEGELSESDDDDVEAETVRLRVLLKDLDDPDAMERIYLRAVQRLRSSGSDAQV
ncbi:hypothetical protein SORBI_3010G024300 [Sorghum bicolor]|uniref:DUF3615 domain-containing protein n=1 Tax=Sorghum bicolor TaxID=4558 RepID=C5Z3E3_SORBI|nr:hypothetical protein SORBI_3010G024300 [Sorghum bicolor]